jgi:5-methylcytosine-specific restriction endonuclease McrA
LTQRICSLDGCDDPYYGRGWCRTHYRRWQRTGDPRGARERAKAIGKGTCECGQPAQVTGKCRRCYQRDWKPRNPKPCSIEDCGESARTLGLCATHYMRWWKTGSTDLVPKTAPQCNDPRCTGRATRQGMCELHYRRWERVAKAERLAASRQAWAVANWEKVRESNSRAARRRLIQKAATSDGPVDYAAILAEHGMVCHICGRPIGGLSDLHFDHVVPLARGGAHTAGNIRPAHKRCNLSKGARLMSELRELRLLPA